MDKKTLLSVVSAILSSLNVVSAVPGNYRISQVRGKNYLKRKRNRNVVLRNLTLKSKEAQLMESSTQKKFSENRNSSKNASKEQDIPKMGKQNSKGFKDLVVEHPITSAIIGGIFTCAVATAIGISVKHYCFGASENNDPTVDTEGNPIVGEVFYGLGNFSNVEGLKNQWANLVASNNEQEFDSNCSKDFPSKLKSLMNTENEFKKALDDEGANKIKSNLNLKGEKQGKLYKTFSEYAQIYFDGDSFKCYHKSKKIELTASERFFIEYVSRYFNEKFGIKPCRVRSDSTGVFRFVFAIDGNSKDMDECTGYMNNMATFEKICGAHITPVFELLCDIAVCKKN